MMEYSDTMDHIEIPTIEMEESLFEVIPKLSRLVSALIFISFLCFTFCHYCYLMPI